MAKEIVTVSPIDGNTLVAYPVDGDDRIEAVLDGAVAAQRTWAGLPLDERGAALRRLAAVLGEERERAARLIVAEMGKPIAEARAEIDKCAWVCEHYAEHAAGYLAETPVETEWARSFVQYPPLGVVLAIMPWNYPFWQVLRAAAPVLAAGNAFVLKHASNVTGCALLLGELAERAELPAGLFAPVVLGGAAVEPLISDRRIAAVTLTGSEAVGARVAQLCGAALKKSVLELGGSDAFVVLDDADLAAAAETAVRARFQNTGQSCIAAKRFVVVESVAEEFEARFAQAASALRVGDPYDEEVQLGPMARADLRDELAGQVRRGLDAGGRLLAGGAPEPGPGAFHPPTVVAGVAPGTPLFAEETFGPAAAVTRAANPADALRLANDSDYGLSSSVWTADVERALALSRDVAAGAVFVNTMSASDPRMPFGGVKRSGWGRELGEWGIREFVNVQAVTVAPRSSA